jgi:cell fate (sporulation/competence/biofilm development) regulator YmcA (YheA/YmcA/DUF963 family)
MTQNGVPTSLVEKLLDNLKDLTKTVAELGIKQNNLQDGLDETSDKIAIAITKVAERLNTPPRHEELEKEIKTLGTQIDQSSKEQKDQNELLKSVVKTIKIAASLFGLALLIAAILMTVIEKTKYSNNNQTKIENIEKSLADHLSKPQSK